MDIEAWKTQFETTYGHLISGPGTSYPKDALLGIVTEENRAGYKVPLFDPEAVHAKVAEIMAWNPARHKGIHFRVLPLKNRVYRYDEAGSTPDSLAFPALFMDWDTADGVHKPLTGEFAGYRHPERHEVIEMIESIMPDTLRVNTGGGFQSIFSLDRGMPVYEPDNITLAKRFQRRWMEAAKERGFGLDLAVGVKLTQTLRVAGSENYKRGALPVTITKHDPSVRYRAWDLNNEIPQLPPVARRATVAWNGAPIQFAGGPTKVGWTFNKNVPVTWLIEGVWGMEPKTSNEGAEFTRYVFPREDGSLSRTDSHMAVKTGSDGIQRAFALSSRIQGALGVPDMSTPITAWDLVLICFGGDIDLATIVVKAHRKPNDALLQTLRSAFITGQLAAAA